MGCAILPRAFTYTCTISWNGEMRGVRGRVLSPWAHNAGAADKTQGQPGRIFSVNTSCRAAIPGGGEWHGQALQDDTIPQGAGGGGGGWAGNVLITTNLSGSLFKVFKGQKWHSCHFHIKSPDLPICASKSRVYPGFQRICYLVLPCLSPRFRAFFSLWFYRPKFQILIF
jgi:hypothetical protein